MRDARDWRALGIHASDASERCPRHMAPAPRDSDDLANLVAIGALAVVAVVLAVGLIYLVAVGAEIPGEVIALGSAVTVGLAGIAGRRTPPPSTP